jgi:hypothetical protein
VARALVGGLMHDIPADDTKLRHLVPQNLLTFRQSVDMALQEEQRPRVATRWTQGLLMFRDFRIDHAYYAKHAGATTGTTASAQALWKVISAIGGDNGYYYADILWRTREVMDWLVGGPGLDKGRDHETEVQLGDRIDYWKVLALEPERRLTLQFGMRAPGSGALEFVITPLGHGRTTLSITAYWHPYGAQGLLYWYAMVPAHLFIFRGMVEAIARRAEAAERQERHAHGAPTVHHAAAPEATPSQAGKTRPAGTPSI